jgi:hypothetical protein
MGAPVLLELGINDPIRFFGSSQTLGTRILRLLELEGGAGAQMLTFLISSGMRDTGMIVAHLCRWAAVLLTLEDATRNSFPWQTLSTSSPSAPTAMTSIPSPQTTTP